MMHEIGNISVDQNILKKPGKLDQEEWKQVKRHQVGFRILLAFNETAHLAGEVCCHITNAMTDLVTRTAYAVNRYL